jgi:hypothetical protein
MEKEQRILKRIIIACSIIFLMLAGCQGSISNGSTPPTSHAFPKPPTPKPDPRAEIFFAVTIPAPLQSGETLLISFLDEVTGLALNPSNHVMQAGDATHYYIALPFALNSIVKYRFLRQGRTSVNEVRTDNSEVRYRLYYVGGPGEVMDTVASWGDSAFSGSTGRITGRVINNQTGSGLPDILVSGGGNQTLSDSNGEFSLEGLVEGTHDLVTYSLDGRYEPYQQGAKIIPGKRTPVEIRLDPSTMVNVVFTVIVPENTVPSVPVRLAGNLLQLGNSFGNLEGGMSTVPVKMPVLTPMLDGRFTISIMLPAGADIRYKYTLGDGFWNAEHQPDGDFTLRQLIVPESGGTIQDYVETWQSGPSAPIIFEVTAPADTPATDSVSIQFNPYGWTQPIQMWSLGNNRWVYKLFSPFNLLGYFEYRYCRNDQCGVADDAATSGRAKGRSVSTSKKPQYFKDVIRTWNWLNNESISFSSQENVVNRDPGFLTGVELQSSFSPTWEPWLSSAFQDIRSMASNMVVLTPSWTYQSEFPLVFAPVLGKDPLGSEISDEIKQAEGLNLKVALFPQAHFPQTSAEWWVDSPRDSTWWDTWFEEYRSFAIYYSDLAMENNVQMLILGGDWMKPALPGGVLTDGSSSNLPVNAETRWSGLVAEVRQHFSGQVYWAVPFPGDLASVPGVINELDGIYLLWFAPLTSLESPTFNQLQSEAERLLDNEVEAIQVTFKKPLILAVAYPSITGSGKACISDGGNRCLDWTSLSQPQTNSDSIKVDLYAQQDAYLAVLKAINTRSWITGFVSRGYYLPAALQDSSASIHGKPVEGLLQYWYTRMLGIIN